MMANRFYLMIFAALCTACSLYATDHATDEMSVPCIDMSRFIHGTEEQRLATAYAFGTALQKIGFVSVTNVGIAPETVDRAYAIIERYFSLPLEEKLKKKSLDGFRGFVPFGKEHAKYTSVMDLKEFYHVTGTTQPDDLWPDMPGFQDAILELYTQLEACMRSCLQATAMYLGYTAPHEQTVLADMLGHGNGVMRLLHYPPVDPVVTPVDAVRSAAHEDLGIMTVIPRATASGLQIKNHQGVWVDVVVPEGAAIVNSGDVLKRISNGIIPSTTHRVVNPPRNDFSPRYSVPFFGNLPADMVLRVLDKCRGNTPAHTLKKEILFGDFRTKRLKKIGIAS
jgi:isopenicillin N synthase-like dioxygenase